MLSFEDNLANSLNGQIDDILEFWTPTEVKSYIDSVKTKVDSLDFDILNNKECTNDALLKDWASYTNRFYDFARDPNLWWLGTVRTAERFAAELRDFQYRYQAICKKSPSSPGVTIPKEQHDKDVKVIAGAANSIIIGAVILGGIYLATKLIK